MAFILYLIPQGLEGITELLSLALCFLLISCDMRCDFSVAISIVIHLWPLDRGPDVI